MGDNDESSIFWFEEILTALADEMPSAESIQRARDAATRGRNYITGDEED